MRHEVSGPVEMKRKTKGGIAYPWIRMSHDTATLQQNRNKGVGMIQAKSCMNNIPRRIDELIGIIFLRDGGLCGRVKRTC